LLHIGIMTIVRSRERPRFLGLISSALQTRAKAFIFLQDESLQFPAAHKARSNECQRERIKNCQLSRYAYRAEIRFFQFVCMRIRRERERERGGRRWGGGNVLEWSITCTGSAPRSRGGSPLSSGQYRLILRRRYRCRTKRTTIHRRALRGLPLARMRVRAISHYNLLLLQRRRHVETFMRLVLLYPPCGHECLDVRVNRYWLLVQSRKYTRFFSRCTVGAPLTGHSN